MCCHQPLRQIPAVYSIALQVQTYFLPGLAHRSSFVVLVFGVPSTSREGYMGGPSVALARCTLDEQHFGISMLDPVLFVEVLNVLRTGDGWLWPVGV